MVVEEKAIDPFDAIGNRGIVEKIVSDQSEGLKSKANECILQCACAVRRIAHFDFMTAVCVPVVVF